MKRLLALFVVGAVSAGLPVPAHADGPGYVGTCRMTVANDSTPDGTMGGPDVWNGEIDVLVVANSPLDSITASCSIKVNTGAESRVLETSPGVGFAATASRVTYTAAITDTVSLCTEVTTGSVGSTDVCVPQTLTPTCPVHNCSNGAYEPCRVVAGAVVCASLTMGSVIDEYTVNGPTNAATRIAGSVDLYRFTLPNGAVTTVPCVVLVAGASAGDPCRSAGGTWVQRMQTLYDNTSNVPTSTLTTPLVRVCNATLVLTVDNIGVNSFPAYAIC